MNKNPIEQIDSSIYDKVVKSVTLFFLLVTILISIGLDIIQGLVDFNSNQSDYDAQNVTVGYISDNLIYKPIKDAYFRDLDCDSSEEVQQLFPFGSLNITRWYSQLICVTRFQDIRLSTSCSDTEYNCGPYCISTSEGSQCPISKMTIIQNEVIDEDADQNLENSRDLYIQRDNSSYGIFQIQVVIRGYPCLNPSIFMTAGLTNETDFEDPENCDGSDYDTDNSVKIEQTSLGDFAEQGLKSLDYNGIPNTVIDSAVTYLTARNKIQSNAEDRCTEIDKQMIYDTENCASSIEEIGFIYLVIKEIFTCLIGITLILEMIILKCRIVNDIRIVTVILKIFIICQMSFILIQGGLILYQEQLRRESQQYFWTIADCYQSTQIQNVFANFPNLFSSDVNIYVGMNRISIIIIGICEFILIMMYIVQMFHWCFKQKKEKKKKQISQQTQQIQLIDTQRPKTQSKDIHNEDVSPKYKNSSQTSHQGFQASVQQNYLQPVAQVYQGPNQQNEQNYSNSIPQENNNMIITQQQPKLTDSYIPPQSSSVAQVVLGKKNKKY